MSAKNVKTTIVETDSGPLVSFESHDPRGFSFHELDVLIAATRHAQRMLIERGNMELEMAAEEDLASEAKFFEQYKGRARGCELVAQIDIAYRAGVQFGDTAGND